MWVYRKGTVEINFETLKTRAPFNQEGYRIELQRKLNEINGVKIPSEKLSKRPSFNIRLLKEESDLQSFLNTMEWILEEIEGYKE